MTRSSVENSLMKIMAYASRPLPDFNKYEALEMLESLQLTAQDTKHDRQNFYRLVYQTVRGKLDVPRDQFRSLVLRLLGDKDHEKIFDCVAKVEKHYRSRDRAGTAAEIISWAWEYDKNFDNAITHGQFGVNAIQWVDSMGNSIAVSGEMTARELMQKVTRVEQGEIIRDVNELSFQDPSNFRAGELHAHYSFWEKVAE
ncbi:unnamed protein product [Pocillopora meandrina]|uniref:Mating type protein MAT1-1-1 n=1 Tax=Pocillopora meandrina TaxID=46732 RepID=A0AAU9XT42_9CNID|nr:unnamed protein product [Pocillopora meandrina]